MRTALCSIGFLLVFASASAYGTQGDPGQFPYFHAPAWEAYARVDPAGGSVLPNGRLVRPLGKLIWTPMNGYSARFGPDGTAYAASGRGRLLRLQDAAGAAPREQWLTQEGGGSVLALARDGTVYWPGLDNGKVYRVRPGATAPDATWDLNREGARDSAISDVALSPNGQRLYVTDIANFRLVCLDTRDGALVFSVPAGRYPYALAVSEDGKQVWVANIGLFRYTRVPPPTTGKFDARGLFRPAFGYPSPEARDGVEFEGRRVAGLGEPNVPDSFSVWSFDLGEERKPKVTSQIKTGILVNATYENGRTVTGSAPSALCLRGTRLFVSNSNNDTLDAIDTRSGRIIGTVRLRPAPALSRYRGVTPYGMTMSRDGRRLYVCEAGLNAVAVIDAVNLRVLGHLPTAWYPTAVDLSPDGKTLLVANAKGLGWGPRDDRIPPRPEQSRFGSLPGCMLLIPIPSDSALPALTAQVLANNGLQPDPERLAREPKGPISPLPGRPSQQIKYVVFITKENHTYDGIFGALPGGRGDRELAWWGAPRKIGEQDGVVVMPNHLKLAQEFARSDNFYMEPEASGDGHRWLVGAYPNIWCQRMFEVGYGFRANSPAPGRLLPFGSNGSLQPEDYLESGSLWEHLSRGGISFRNYGEGFELAGQLEEPGTKPTGSILLSNVPMPRPLFDNTCWEFPAYNNNIPDQYRADQFIKDLEKYPAGLLLDSKLPGGGSKLPRFLNAAICNDHGASPRPETGFPYNASFLADNDLALGRMVEYLTHRPEWHQMAIFITQDDSGGDPDHIDRHRSICMVLSPWVKRGYVSRRHTSISSIIKTIYLTFGLPPCNLYDATATDLSDFFTTKPDFRPYRHVGVDARIFDPRNARDPGDPDYKLARLKPSIALDDPRFTHHLRPDGSRRPGRRDHDDDDDDE